MHVLRCPTMHLTFPTSFLAPPLLSKPMTVTLAAQGPASKILYKQFLPQAPKKCNLGKHTNGSSLFTIPAVRQQKSNYLNVSLEELNNNNWRHTMKNCFKITFSKKSQSYSARQLGDANIPFHFSFTRDEK